MVMAQRVATRTSTPSGHRRWQLWRKSKVRRVQELVAGHVQSLVQVSATAHSRTVKSDHWAKESSTPSSPSPESPMRVHRSQFSYECSTWAVQLERGEGRGRGGSEERADERRGGFLYPGG